ncbi:DegV family protein [Actinosynnema sp. NPDC047251]|uniref:DegV domain-containing protein n=1 Tax=Saccharothrix espanaensis (strain ATCC 51144 / DSM 44229 / JCM 9112 / NBRC 15066 / NRRL 15764) TaxID=1179773 RepID=K0KAD3_SACES|nr:DegV family protein [Saccharothrix espanaensis]CCH34487.1 DegV domain-containing protein [Saccharothrix espanaensis DSM 44229]
MHRRVAIVTDSTACLPPQLAEKLGITVAQIQLRIGDQVDDEARVPLPRLVDALRDQEDVATSPPDPGAFFWTYADAATAGAEAVVSLHVSTDLSRTAEAARQAADQARVPVHVVDTRTCGMSLGYAVVAAATAAAAGGDVRRVVAAAQQSFRRSTELFYVDTLEYLRRGGRIGAAAALLGSALSVKPLLTMTDGRIAPLDKVLGAERALRRMIDIAVGRAGGGEVDIAVEHFSAPERAQSVLEQLRAKLPTVRRFLVTTVSSAIGAHVGPGAVGVTVSPV